MEWGLPTIKDVVGFIENLLSIGALLTTFLTALVTLIISKKLFLTHPTSEPLTKKNFIAD
jgi:hypothetical protein